MGVYTVTPQGIYAAQLVRQYFPQSAWVTMVAVADAESGFNPTIINTSSGATGLFQIKYWLHGITKAQALNPVINTQTAARLYAQQGLAPWAGDGYPAYLGIAATLVSLAGAQAARAPQFAAVRVLSSFHVTGTASVTSGGRIVGTVTLNAVGAAIPYKVVMAVSPAYGSSEPTTTVATGTAPIGTSTVTQSLVAPLPSPELIRAHQLQQPGPVTFSYAVTWTVTNTANGQSATASAAHRVQLTIP